MKRFYKAVTCEPINTGKSEESGWRVLLDDRAIKTACGSQQLVPTQSLAEAMASEWAGQGEVIDPAAFPFRDLADYAIDIAGPQRTTVLATVLRFAETDTLCYRAEPDEALHHRQLAVWEPLLSSAERRWVVHFERVDGVIHRPQPPATLAQMAKVLATHDSFSFAALQTLASLAASLVVALAAIEPDADPEVLWSAANLEEDWQAELWGKDAEAEALRTRRLAEFAAAMRFAGLARG
jgi:chaperone required for assembly of F1-ATPase